MDNGGFDDMLNVAKMEQISIKIDKLFNDALDVKDTIWYTEVETLRDAILRIIEQEFEAGK